MAAVRRTLDGLVRRRIRESVHDLSLVAAQEQGFDPEAWTMPRTALRSVGLASAVRLLCKVPNGGVGAVSSTLWETARVGLVVLLVGRCTLQDRERERELVDG